MPKLIRKSKTTKTRGSKVTKTTKKGITEKAWIDKARIKATNKNLKQIRKIRNAAEVEKTKRAIARSTAIASVGNEAFDDNNSLDTYNALIAGGVSGNYNDNNTTNNDNNSNPNGIKGRRYMTDEDLGIKR